MDDEAENKLAAAITEATMQYLSDCLDIHYSVLQSPEPPYQVLSRQEIILEFIASMLHESNVIKRCILSSTLPVIPDDFKRQEYIAWVCASLIEEIQAMPGDVEKSDKRHKAYDLFH